MIDTKVKTKSVTNTQLVVATMAAFMAGGLAFASVPAQNRVAAAPKCGVNSYSVLSLARGCASGQYTGIDFACHDGSRHQHRPGVCTPLAQLKNTANATCANRCAGAPVVQNGTLSLTVDNEYPAIRYDRYVLAGTDRYLATRIRLEAINEDIELNELGLEFSFDPNNPDVNTNNLLESIDSVYLYTNANLADNSRIGATAFTSTTVVIENLRLRTNQNVPTYLYIGLRMKGVGSAVQNTAVPGSWFRVSPSFTRTLARGFGSDRSVTVRSQVGGNNSSQMMVNALKLMNVQSNFPEGNLVGGNQTLFSFSLTADAGENTDINGDLLRARLLNIDLQLTSDLATDLAQNISNLELCRSDSGNCIPLTTAAALSPQRVQVPLTNAVNPSNTVLFSPFADDSDEFIDSGETVEFIVRGTVVNATDHFVQLRILNLDNEGLTYGYSLTGDDHMYSFSDIRQDHPRSANYPTVIGGALD